MNKQHNNHFIDRPDVGERAILVHMHGYPRDFEVLKEFKELGRSAGVSILDIITGNQLKPEPRYFIGKGKVEEVQAAVQALHANVVIFNHDLSPAQERNLESRLQCRVLGRTGLILDIFANRARSHEGKLQVELAQLKHLSTRLVRGWSHLERQRGGIGLRGPGETQLETDRRLLGLRIKAINKQLKKVDQQRKQGRRSRRRADIPTVALVGYTNAGKSTLFYQMTDSDVYRANQLFATLDPTLRRMTLSQLGDVIVADTVGFIRDLPHDLVVAFKTTLQEVKEADLLLHVLDANVVWMDDHKKAVTQVLHDIGAEHVPQIEIYNKIDLQASYSPIISDVQEGKRVSVALSALTGEGLEYLYQAMRQRLGERWVSRDIILPVSEGQLRAMLYGMGVVRDESIDEHGEIHLMLYIQYKDYQRVCTSLNGKTYI